jgi:hypothetical protein
MTFSGRLGIGAFVLSLGLLAAAQPAGRAREVARIRGHFDSVLVELGQRDVSALPAPALVHREALVAELRRYKDRGEFPHNYDFPGEAVPYFVDRETGVHCAVANLLAKSGRSDIVDRVRRTNNNVWVAELRGDTAFRGWLNENGLTLAEAARIQVPYAQPTSSAETVRNVGFAVATLTAMVGSTVTSLINVSANSSGAHARLAKSGIVFGIASGILGARMATDRDFGSIGMGAMVLGGVSTGVGALSLHQRSVLAAKADSSRARAVAEARVEPTVDARGNAGARVGMHIDF